MPPRYDSRMTMIRCRSFGAALAATLLAAGCTLLPTRPAPEPTPAERGIKPLTGPEVRALLGKAHYRWEGAQGASGTAITSGDGRVRVMWETGAVNGRMRFTDTGYCSRFERVRDGAEDCYRLYRTGPNEFTVVREDGTPSGKIALVK